MIGIEIKRIQIIHKRFQKEIEAHRTSALRTLQAIDPLPFNANERAYLTTIIAHFTKPGFLMEDPTNLQTMSSTLNLPLASVQPNGRSLKEQILKALNYKRLRSTFYPKYFREIGIKACVYCNSQLTITLIKSKARRVMARFDVDHYLPKDDFPFLSISLFNLYPVCAGCNRTKSTRRVRFDLYVDKPSLNSNFKFKLDEHSKSHYLTNFDVEKLVVGFTEPLPVPAGYETFQDVFSVQEIHSTQKDIVEELIIKSQIYNDAHKQQLRNSFSRISLNEKLFERVIVGNYVEEKDIHKRPLSKMMIDIARDLKIID